MGTYNIGATSTTNQRLKTFQESPMVFSDSVSDGGESLSSMLIIPPVQFAEAGFSRPSFSSGDEVMCMHCGVKFKGWTDESPFVVHLTLSPGCLFVRKIAPSYLTMTARQHLQLMRFLPVDSPSLLKIFDARNPSEQPHYDSNDKGLLLFESHRLATFPSPTHPKAKKLAEAGIVFQDGEWICVFCSYRVRSDMDNPSEMHNQDDCALVRMTAGNITTTMERQIKQKHRELYGHTDCVCGSMKSPQLEKIKERRDTFTTWPKYLTPTPEELSEAGFHYSGYSDKVVCFACGCTLRNWHPDAIVWIQHAKLSPDCVFVQQQKGHDFRKAAKLASMQAEKDTSSQGAHSVTGQRHVNSPFCPTLESEAVLAAMESGLFPNETLLLATLKAFDETFHDIQSQRETIHEKDIFLANKDEVIEQKAHIIEQKAHVIEQKAHVIEQKAQVIEQKDQALKRKDEEHLRDVEMMETRNQVIEAQDLQLAAKDELVDHQQKQLEKNQMELDRKSEEMRRQHQEMQRQHEMMQRKIQRQQEMMQREIQRQQEMMQREIQRHQEMMQRQQQEIYRQQQELQILREAHDVQNNITCVNAINATLPDHDPASLHAQCDMDMQVLE